MSRDSAQSFTFRDRGRIRATRVLGTPNLKESYDTCTSFTPYTHAETGAGALVSALDGSNAIGIDGGQFQYALGAAASSYAIAYVSGYQISDAILTSGWMLRAHVACTTTPGTQTEVVLGFGDSAVFNAQIGIVGSALTGGSATKFAMTKRNAATTRTAGALSTVSIDTSKHVLEMWHRRNDINIYGAVDEETPISMGIGDMAAVFQQVYIGARNNAVATAVNARSYQIQVIVDAS